MFSATSNVHSCHFGVFTEIHQYSKNITPQWITGTLQSAQTALSRSPRLPHIFQKPNRLRTKEHRRIRFPSLLPPLNELLGSEVAATKSAFSLSSFDLVALSIQPAKCRIKVSIVKCPITRALYGNGSPLIMHCVTKVCLS